MEGDRNWYSTALQTIFAIHVGEKTMANGDTLSTFIPTEQSVNALQTARARFGYKNGYPVAIFDDTNVQSVIFQGYADVRKAGGNYTVKINHSSEVTTGDVRLGVAVARMVANDAAFDADVDNYATRQEATATTNGTAGRITTTTLTITNANFDAVAADENYAIRISRVATNAADTMVGDLYIHSVIVGDAT